MVIYGVLVLIVVLIIKNNKWNRGGLGQTSRYGRRIEEQKKKLNGGAATLVESDSSIANGLWSISTPLYFFFSLKKKYSVDVDSGMNELE